MTPDEHQALHRRAYAAMDRGDLAGAVRGFSALVAHAPEDRYYHYMLGLAHKYRMDWAASLRHNERALALADTPDEAACWNGAIAATALDDWPTARRLWSACGVGVPGGDGPIAGDYGIAAVRLNPWHGGETVFVRRIDPVRARLLNVPLPESGHRFGDIVLHDGASTGRRIDIDGREVPVFNALERLEASPFRTYVASVHCDGAADSDALRDAMAPGIGHVEDWTDSVAYLCLRCSHGTPHRHAAAEPGRWNPERTLGIAAQARAAVESLLEAWAQRGPGRHVDGIGTREHAVPPREDGHAWWSDPAEDDGAEARD